VLRFPVVALRGAFKPTGEAAMFTKELKADYLGHHIAVRNSWGPGLSLKFLSLDLELYIDGEIADTNLEFFGINNKAALLRGAITDQGQPHLIEVYGRSIWRRRLKICIDGTKIAGDLP
jgi:hypothetical protein